MNKPLLILSIVLIAIASSQTANAVVIFQEDFSGSELPSGWNFDTDGVWSIENNELSQGTTYTTPGHADCGAGDESWTDYSMQARFQYLVFGSNNMEAGIIMRGSNAGGIVARTSWRGGSWNLELMRSGMDEWHVPLNQSLTTGQWYTMKGQIEGELLKVWVNDVLYDFGDIYPSSSTLPTAGRVGLWSNNAHTHFDDVMVDNLQSTVPEPATMLLFSLGGVGMAFLRRRKVFKRCGNMST